MYIKSSHNPHINITDGELLISGDIDRRDEVEDGGKVHDVLGEEGLEAPPGGIVGAGIEGWGQDDTQTNYNDEGFKHLAHSNLLTQFAF